MGNAGQVFVLLHGSARDATIWEPMLRHPPAGAPVAALVLE